MVFRYSTSKMMASRSSIGKCFEDASESGRLNISHRGLKKLPASVDEYDLADVQFIDMSRNRFNELPEEILSFVMLERLNCSRNFVKTVPDLYNLNSLSHINISQNQLQTLPIYLCHLPLKILKASHNRISSLPSEIGTLSRLQCLDLACNELTNLPSTVGDLHSLRSLNIHRNNIVILPDELSKLKNLHNLDFSSNKISVIPPAYRLMQSLIKLNLKNNPLTSPPAKTCVKGRVHLIKCLGVTAQQDEKRWSIPTETLLNRSPSLSTVSNQSRNSKTEHEPQTAEVVPLTDTSRNDKSKMSDGSVLFEKDESLEDGERSLMNEMTNIMNDKLSLSSKLSSSDLCEEPSAVVSEDIPRSPSCQSPEEDKPLLPPKPTKLHTSETMNEKRLVAPEKGKLTPQSHRTPATTPTTSKTFPYNMEEAEQNNITPYVTTNRTPDGTTGSFRYEKKTASTTADDKCDDITTRQKHLLKSREEVLESKQRLESIKYKTLPLSYEKNPEMPFDGLKKRTHIAKQQSKKFLEGASNYTMKRYNDSAKEEFVELEKLRAVIEEKLRIKLPDDLPASLSDGIVLCHFVNHLRKGTIHSIHVPSSGVPKLTMPKCQMNVDAFLDACRKLGVNKTDLCAPPDILEEKNPTNLCKTVHLLLLALGIGIPSDTSVSHISPPR